MQHKTALRHIQSHHSKSHNVADHCNVVVVSSLLEPSTWTWALTATLICVCGSARSSQASNSGMFISSSTTSKGKMKNVFCFNCQSEDPILDCKQNTSQDDPSIDQSFIYSFISVIKPRLVVVVLLLVGFGVNLFI